ncbi:GumC family protein [Sabulicella glaciei]|uniref:Polysaccharide biosynthesis tyrosine autokinase n=1 Tax=Sabulicella glaciei TaxID=2984948 RepID=A0ABT3P0Z1_9PROT|nr:polysaccharide biosynthesis tyrosine autokinase [Roseococcus sp. MDT2-1-1]MCW8088095.1 polysaccharide biosynthesis tyrosine autokinase [Roseococcus sp. MDT2-1-1]
MSDAGSAPTEPFVTLRDVFGVLRAYWRPVLLATIVLAVLIGAALTQATPVFTAQATLVLDLRRPGIPGLPTGAPPPPVSPDPAILRSEVDMLGSRPVIREVVERLNLVELSEFRKPGLASRLAEALGFSLDDLKAQLREMLGRPEPEPLGNDPLDWVISQYGDRLAIINDGRSYMIRVSFRSEDPALSARVANAHVAAYLRLQTELKREVGRSASAWLNSELEELQARVRSAEQAVQRFREENEIVEARGDTLLAQRIAEVNNQLTSAVSERSAREARLTQAREQVRRGEADRVTEVGGSPVIQRLREQEATVIRREAEQASRFGPRHPEILRIRAELRDLRSAIGQEIRRAISSLESEVAVAQARESDLRTQVSSLERRVATTEQAEITLRELEREAAASRSLYENLLLQRQQIAVQQGLQLPDVRVVSEATPPAKPSSPNVLRFTLMGAALAGMLLMGVAFVREFVHGGIRGVADLERATGLPCLGTIPALRRREIAKRGASEIMVQEPLSRFADAVRSLRVALLSQFPDRRPPATLLVTSALPGEGKTTLAFALAQSLVDAGHRVLLIDADLRRNSPVPRGEADARRVWLNDLLKPGGDELWPVLPDPETGLAYVPSRASDRAPQDVLGSPAVLRALKRAAHDFDVVLLDSPPLVAASDALVLGALAEATILVARWRRTPRDAAASAAAELAKAGFPVVGAVLTLVKSDSPLFQAGELETYRRQAKSYYDSLPAPQRPAREHGRRRAAEMTHRPTREETSP